MAGMKQSSSEQIEHHACPGHVARELRLAGGDNRYGEPMFRLVWGYDRIVPMSGEWQEFEHAVATLTDKLTGHTESRTFIRLKESKIETRMVPKYLPANSWHLEMWRPPEEYGSPDAWRKQGEEVIAGMTIDTAGEFPSRGEYELVFPITDDLTVNGHPMPLHADLIANLVGMIRAGKERHTFAQRRAAIEQRLKREEEGFTRRAIDIMKDGLRPYAGEAFVTVAENLRGQKPATEKIQ
jgi:hypothetical protein